MINKKALINNRLANKKLNNNLLNINNKDKIRTN